MRIQARWTALCASTTLLGCGGSIHDARILDTVNTNSTFELDAYGPIPADMEKRLTCPQVENGTPESTLFGKRRVHQPFSEAGFGQAGWQNRVAADWSALSALGLGNMEVVVIDIRRVNGVPHYYYLSNGKQTNVFEPWSSSKFLAVLAAGRRSRMESDGRVGLDSRVGQYDIGDMISAIHKYKPVGNVSQSDNIMLSNALASYFLGVAGREYATSMLHEDWLNVADRSEFRGGYGTSPFTVNDVLWHPYSGEAPHRMGHIGGTAASKNMSALVLAEALKRVTQSEIDSETGIDPLTSADLATLLYGSPNRTGEMGGMLAGESVYLAKALTGAAVGNMSGFGGQPNAAAKAMLDRKTGGKWRFFHKLGAGDSTSRRVSEIVMSAYACLPGYQGGREFVIATSAHASSLGQANSMTTRAFNLIVQELAKDFSLSEGEN